MAEILTEIRKIPIVTRTLVGLALGVTGPVALGMLDPYYILWSSRHILKKLEVWRVITPFFFAGSGMQLLFDLFLLYRNSIALETQSFAGRSAEYAWIIICLMGAVVGTNYPLGSVIFWGPLMSGLGFLWSQINPEAMVSLFGLPPFKAAYFPFAMLALDFVRGGMPLASQSLSGVLAGYAVHYLTYVYPPSNGGQRPWFMYPPAFLVRLIDGPGQTTGSGQRLGAGTAFAPGSRAWGGQAPVQPAGGRPTGPTGSSSTGHRWGSGNRLG
ncbi:hypothetical protein CROQUDRAFT_65588 [Cronartium quercuum f. sp. fusiforme G11]|uniref:Derlin n=1 Tax=Cronartium quercuum f. sp. fusiforme G11 TaxID=708437 RepID=A0A9P6NC79_9BASI|nr:hypothetical protein CROQUDRAFT_65588 [Cronartium quercuum f. sp. fusiforme G11]